ncbi:seminase [Drosophila busckii]|uniref:seminase n=1 Tax=Drosophila busckii TaxID=30019 RepID=UPI00083E9E9A|nr:seminase [Drosophila busckii]
MRLLLIAFLICLMPTAWTKIYKGYISKRTKVQKRFWGGMDTNTGANFGGWLLRIMNSDGTFACGASYYAPMLVLTSANCIRPYRNSLDGVSVEGTAIYGEERDNYALIDTIYMPESFKPRQTDMDIAVVRLMRPIKGRLTEFIKLCETYPLTGMRMTAFAWGYDSFDVQPPSHLTKKGDVLVENFAECRRKFKGMLDLTLTSICVTEPKDPRLCLYDGGSPLIYKDELCGIVSYGSGCSNTSIPGVYTNIMEVKKYIFSIQKGIKSGAIE